METPVLPEVEPPEVIAEPEEAESTPTDSLTTGATGDEAEAPVGFERNIQDFPANLLQNPSFEAWEDSLVGWQVTGAEVAATDDTTEGETSVELAATADSASLRQKLGVNYDLAGMRLTAAIDAKTSAAEGVRLVLEYRLDGKWVPTNSLMHPGDGQWRRLEVSREIPADVAPGGVAFKLIVDGDDPVILDNATLAVD